MLIAHQCCSYCRAVLTQSQGLSYFLCCPASKEARDAEETGKGHRQDSGSRMTKGIFHTIWHYVQQAGVKKKKKGGHSG